MRPFLRCVLLRLFLGFPYLFPAVEREVADEFRPCGFRCPVRNLKKATESASRTDEARDQGERVRLRGQHLCRASTHCRRMQRSGGPLSIAQISAEAAYARGIHKRIGRTSRLDARQGRSARQVKSPASPTAPSRSASARACSLRRDLCSIWRMRSRVTLNVRPTSSSVHGCSPPSP